MPYLEVAWCCQSRIDESLPLPDRYRKCGNCGASPFPIMRMSEDTPEAYESVCQTINDAKTKGHAYESYERVLVGDEADQFMTRYRRLFTR